MLSFKDALQIITSCVPPKTKENVSLGLALGRFLAQDLFSLTTLPRYPSAFKDGFALRFAEVAAASTENPVELKVTGESFAGGPYFHADSAPLTACKITTGAYIPLGFDTVIPWEDCEVKPDGVVVTQTPRPNQDVTPAGQELNQQDLILRKGIALKPADIGLAAAAGYAELPVVRSPRIGIISTGNELVLPGRTLEDGQIYSSNQFQLKTQLSGMHMPAEAVVIKDDFEAIKRGVLALIQRHDVLISSGGSADSEKDFMGLVLKELNWHLLVEKVNIKPGHTLRFGLLFNKPFFVLPGTPSGTEICFNIFVVPLLRKMSGADNILPPVVYARLSHNIKGAVKTQSVAQAVLTFEQSGPVLEMVPKEYGRLKSIARKNALIMVPQAGLEAGSIVEAILV